MFFIIIGVVILNRDNSYSKINFLSGRNEAISQCKNDLNKFLKVVEVK